MHWALKNTRTSISIIYYHFLITINHNLPKTQGDSYVDHPHSHSLICLVVPYYDSATAPQLYQWGCGGVITTAFGWLTLLSGNEDL